MKYACLAFLVLIIFCYCFPYQGECVQVLDGDTIIFKRFGKEERVRLLYIDTPEEAQGRPARLATEYLKQRIEGKKISLKERGVDMYGRTLAVIYLGKTNINFEMIQKGMAFPYRFQKFKNSTQKRNYLLAFELAKLKRLGIFSESEILEPYHFRRSLRR